ncbi:carbohydrate-binding protein [Paenibacillus yonginensis]|uniref:Carbohydrate-binding protein n=1 Tax=Paenibacillus yonginensis TaxID=1462996 RepID=A0A1B1MYV2_9BACL|nr:carbohydrate-binding protein [Paenibacillus yonginensis]ANS74346.1 carbohydrate-binding protein [Paenibacillus yonginensis]
MPIRPINRFLQKSAAAVMPLILALAFSNGSIAAPADSSAHGREASAALVSYEAEASGNTFTGNAGPVACDSCSGGSKVGNLYGGSTLQLNGVNVSQAGVYDLTISYISGDSRAASLSVNGGEKESISFPKTADWNTVGQYTYQIYLQEGSNTLLFDDDNGYSPDFDKIELVYDAAGSEGPSGDGNIGALGKLVSVSKYGAITLTEYKKGFKVSSSSYDVVYNTHTGLSQYNWGGRTVATGLYSMIDTGNQLSSKDYNSHMFSKQEIVPFRDTVGKGIRLTVHNKKQGAPTLDQIYTIYEKGPYLLTQTVAKQSKPLATNYIAPVVMEAKGGIDIGSYGDNRVLVAPFDNDAWSRYQSKSMNTNLNNHNFVSSELTAVFDNTSRSGLVLGSVTHDTWKTGIYWSGSDNKLNQLQVYGGFASPSSTRDSIAHGKVTGTSVASPEIFVGFYSDYRTGLEAYGAANAAVAPPLAFGPDIPSGVPVGWNSWGAYSSNVSYDAVADTSEYFKNQLQNHSFENDGSVYINLDSYWDNMNDQQLADLVALIHGNGQKAGIYYSPFVYWGDNLEQTVEGTNGAYKYGDIVLRDNNGQVLPKLDGAYAVDPTHPAVKQRLDYYMDRFKKAGFEYIKVDFLTHGSLEGKHYDPAVQTGIQAYNEGMAYLDQSAGGTMFISASIAPIFPSQYAHSRRISCDVDGSISSTEYQLNNLTYGWWQNGTIYSYTDPDYMALSKGGSLEGARSRVNAAAISGTVYLDSDDVHDAAAREYMEALLTNPAINKVALKGKAFRPVEGNTGTHAADTFVLEEGHTFYLATFNYTNTYIARTVDLERAGLKGSRAYKLTDLWTGETSTVRGSFHTALQGAGSKLFKLEPMN